MKKLATIILIGFSFCNMPVKKLKLFNGQAFVVKTPRGFKLNYVIKSMNFRQEKIDSFYEAHLYYSVNLATPAKDTLLDVDNGMIDKNSISRLDTITIKSSIELDSSFQQGNYLLLFLVQDNISNEKAEINIPVSVKL